MLPHTTHRKIARQINESARDVARQLATTPRYAQSRRHRKKVEMLFAHPTVSHAAICESASSVYA